MGTIPDADARSGAEAAHNADGPGRTTRHTARTATVLSLGELLGKVATLAYTVAAARILTQQEFGAFAYAIAFSLLVATLPSWGFDPLLTQRGARDPRRLPGLVSETLVWRTAIAIPVFAGAAIAGAAISPGREAAVTLLLVLTATFFDEYSDTARAAAAALQRQMGVSVALVVQRATTAALAITALVSGFGLIGLALSYLAGSVVGLVAVVIVARRIGVTLDRSSVTRTGLLRTGKLSIALGIDVLVAMALFRIDQIILGALRGQAEVGAYAAAYRLIEAVLFLSWAVKRAVFPVMSAATETARVRRGLEQALAALAVLYLPFAVGLWIEAGPALDLLYGEPYATESLGALRWLAPTPMVFAIGFLGSFALLARGRRLAILLSSLAAAAANVALNLALIPSLGGTGAAIATSISYAGEAAIVLIMLRPVIGRVRLERALLLPLLPCAVMGAALLSLRLPLLVEAPLGLAVYAAAWLPLARWRAPEQLAVIRSVAPWRR